MGTPTLPGEPLTPLCDELLLNVQPKSLCQESTLLSVLFTTPLLQACPVPQKFLQIKIKAIMSPPAPAELLACRDPQLNAHKTAKKQKILLLKASRSKSQR